MKSAHFASLLLSFTATSDVVFSAPTEKSAAKSTAPAQAKSAPGGPAPSTVAAKPDAADIASLRAKAERGNALAQYNLGLAYAQGRQVAADDIQALVWLTLASEGGSTGKALETVLSRLSHTELAQAQQKLDAMRASNPYLRQPAIPSSKTTNPATAATPAPIVSDPAPVATITAPAATPVAEPPASRAPASSRAASRAADEPRSTDESAPGSAPVVEQRDWAAEVATLRKEKERLEVELASARSAKNFAVTTQKSLKQTKAALASQSAELTAARAEANTARNDLERTKAELASARDSLARQSTVVSTGDEATAALARERASHAETQAALAQAKARTESSTNSAQAHRQELNSLEAKLSAAETQLALRAQTENATRQELEKARATGTELATTQAALRDLAAGREKDLLAHRQALEDTRAQLAATESKLRESAQLRERAETNARTIVSADQGKRSAELDAAVAKANSANAELASLRAELASTRQRSDELAAQLGAAQATVKASGSTRAEAAAQIAAQTGPLRTQIASLQKEVQEATRGRDDARIETRTQRDTLDAERSTWAQEKLRLSAELAAAGTKEESARQLATEKETLTARLAQAEAALRQHGDTQKRTEAMGGELAALRTELEKVTATAASATAEKARSQSELAARNAELQTARDSWKRDQSLASEAVATAQKKDEALRQLTAEKEALARRLAAAEDHARVALAGTNNVAALEASAAARERDLATLQSRFEAATAERDALVARLTAAESAQKAAQQDSSRVATLSRELAVAREEIAAAKGLDQRTSAAIGSISKLESEKRQLAADLAAATSDKSKLASEQQSVRQELEALRESLAKSETMRTELSRRAEASADADARTRMLQANLAASEQKLAAATRGREEAQEKLRAATKSSKDLSSHAEHLAESHTKAEARVARLTEEKESLSRRLAQAEAKVTVAVDANRATVPAVELETARRNGTELQQQLATATKELETLRKLNSDVAAKLAASNEAHNRAEARAAISAAAAANAAKPLVTELDALRARASAAEQAADLARAELARTNQLLASARSQPAEPVRAPAPVGQIELARPTALTPVPPTRLATPPQPAPRTHTIAAGDTLSGISRQYYGTANRWSEILAANRDVLRDERSLVAGRTLRIP